MNVELTAELDALRAKVARVEAICDALDADDDYVRSWKCSSQIRAAVEANETDGILQAEADGIDSYMRGEANGISLAFNFIETLIPSVRAADLQVSFDRAALSEPQP